MLHRSSVIGVPEYSGRGLCDSLLMLTIAVRARWRSMKMPRVSMAGGRSSVWELGARGPEDPPALLSVCIPSLTSLTTFSDHSV